jgi:hypothetical protein
MFVNPVMAVAAALLTAAASATMSSETDASRPCAELGALRENTEASAARLAEWMEGHCPGALEDTQPFCRFQSRTLLERLDELGELKAALGAKGCQGGEVRNGDAPERASPVQVAATPPHGFEHLRIIGAFDDNWPWPRRPTFQAGLAASAGFRIRKCRANPDCEW